MQHKLLSEEFLLKEFLYQGGGSFFIAGNAKQMPDQVRNVADCQKKSHSLKVTTVYNFRSCLPSVAA